MAAQRTQSMDDEIIEALRPIIARIAQEDPKAREGGFFMDLFVGIGIGAGLTDGLSEEQIGERVKSRTAEILAEARK